MRNKLIFFLSLIAATLALPSLLTAKLNVVTSTPNLGSIAQTIGGDRVDVKTIARSGEDPHFVTPRPSIIPLLNRADLLIEVGADLEIGWLPPLIQSARNRNILPGAAGRIEMAEHIDLIDIPTGTVDRRAGDIHLRGNPHFLLDPENGKIAAAVLQEAFTEADPEGAAIYEKNAEAFIAELTEKIEAWQTTLAPLQGTEVVTYHKNFNYFANRFGFRVIGEVEPLAGIEPSPRHLRNLTERMTDRNVPMLWIETHRPQRTPKRVADSSGAKLIRLPEQVGAIKTAPTYLSMIDTIVKEITKASPK